MDLSPEPFMSTVNTVYTVVVVRANKKMEKVAHLVVACF
jgi:hypothetical protein